MAYRVAITCAIVTVEGILCYRRSKEEFEKKQKIRMRQFGKPPNRHETTRPRHVKKHNPNPTSAGEGFGLLLRIKKDVIIMAIQSLYK